MQKINRHFWGKLKCFPAKIKIFLPNPNDNLKNRCHSKIVLGHAVFLVLV